MTESVAIAMPIIKGKFEQWKAFTDKLNNGYRKEFEKSRHDAGIHERTFLQHTPDGDLVICNIEGKDPLVSFFKMFQSDDAYTKWFVEQVKEVHGFDLTNPPAGPPPELVTDSENM